MSTESHGIGPKMVDARRLYVPLAQLGFYVATLTGGAVYLRDGFNAIDRKFDRIEYRLDAISEKVADPVTRDEMRQYFQLYKALNPTHNVPPFE